MVADSKAMLSVPTTIRGHLALAGSDQALYDSIGWQSIEPQLLLRAVPDQMTRAALLRPGHQRRRIVGKVRQRGSIADMVFSVAELIAYISRFLTLEPGDMFSRYAGTPVGGAVGMKPSHFLQPSQHVTLGLRLRRTSPEDRRSPIHLTWNVLSCGT